MTVIAFHAARPNRRRSHRRRIVTRNILGKPTLASGQRGMLSTVKDGKNNTITLSDWYRSLPRLITHPGSVSLGYCTILEGFPITRHCLLHAPGGEVLSRRQLV